MLHATVPRRRASACAVRDTDHASSPSVASGDAFGTRRDERKPLGPIGRRRAALVEARRRRTGHLRTGLASVVGLLTLTTALSALPAEAGFGPTGAPPRPESVPGAAAVAPAATPRPVAWAQGFVEETQSRTAARLVLGRGHAGDAIVLRPIPRSGYSRVALATPDPDARASLVGEPPTPTPTAPPTPRPTPDPTAAPTAKPTPRATAKPTPEPTARPARQASNATTAVSSGFVWPVPGGELSQGYHGGHEAIDIHAPTGTPVAAAASGEVVFAGWKDNGGGYQVWLRHGDLITTYSHMSSVAVGRGAWVGAGQRIGRVGATGWATGPHLHFEVWVGYPWQGGYRVSPFRYL